MDSHKESQDFEVLGYKIRLRADNDNERVAPAEAVERVRIEALKIREKAPNLAAGEVAILVALNLAEQNLLLADEYKDNIELLHSTAGDALKFIEEVTPTTV
ncbi:MAG: cell division protein ZapA [Halobacteriovoraceae bacterium]|jgi:hypothetical protein|nr:cell division protein ZapA [Halobacteriovoraceae bacterium]MBT5092646.1 cell division protein ZapA [Halobacteriovoraceae bacterium]